MTATPDVGVVVVNYNGGDLTIRCLEHLLATAWPEELLDVVLVDNASDDGIVARVRSQLPKVRIIESEHNVGFAGGCNLGIHALQDADHVALVNNDANVAPDWLVPLVDVLVADPKLGAACPRILFASPYRELTIESPTHRPGRGDRRELGVRVSGARVDDHDVFTRTQFVSGFWGPEFGGASEARFQWTNVHATLRLPSSTPVGERASLRLAADSAQRVTVRSGLDHAVLDVDSTPRWYDVPFASAASDIVNNVGSVLTADGFGADRGFLELDSASFDEPADVFAWCGAAVLLRGEYLAHVGLLDEQLFLYYEDFELSWRGGRCGWRYRYVPTSIVRHVHSATTGAGSRLARYYDDRNRLLVLARHGSFGRVVRAWVRFLLVTASYAARDVVAPALHGHRPRFALVAGRLRSWGGAVWRLPSVIARRQRDRRLVAEAGRS